MSKNEYVLRVEFSGGSNGKDAQSKARDKQAKINDAMTNYVKAQAIMPFIELTENVYFNNLQTSTGATQLVERQRAVVGVVKEGINLYKSTMGGVAFGAALGMSTLSGGLLGFGSAVLTKVFGWVQRANEIENKKKIENINLDYARTRAGAAFNKSRTGA